jgi:hypothetical protein
VRAAAGALKLQIHRPTSMKPPMKKRKSTVNFARLRFM